MQEAVISGVLVKSKVPGRRGGTAYTVTNRDRTQSITFTDYTTPHDGDTKMFRNVTMKLVIDETQSSPIDPVKGMAG